MTKELLQRADEINTEINEAFEMSESNSVEIDHMFNIAEDAQKLIKALADELRGREYNDDDIKSALLWAKNTRELISYTKDNNVKTKVALKFADHIENLSASLKEKESEVKALADELRGREKQQSTPKHFKEGDKVIRTLIVKREYKVSKATKENVWLETVYGGVPISEIEHVTLPQPPKEEL